MRFNTALLWATTALHLSALEAGATITGQKWCNKYICVTGQHDSSQKIDQYTLEPPEGDTIPLSSFGWMAIGFGSTMADTPMVIGWPNSDGSITLSQRESTSHSMPTVVSSPSREATLLSSASFSNSSTTSISFTLPSNSTVSNGTSIIFAVGSTNPGDSAEDATLKQHSVSGNTKIYLLTPWSANSTGSSNTTSSNGSGDDDTSSADSASSKRHKMLIAHVVCGAVATMALFPIGIITPRIARGLTTSRWWFPVHGAVNGMLGFGLVVAAFGIARGNFDGKFETSHRKLGLALFVLCIFQTLLGIYTHSYRPTPNQKRFTTSSGRGPSNFIHMTLGLVVVAIGFATVWKGLDEEWEIWSGTGKPATGWKVGWGLVVGITALVYLAGLYLIPRQLHNERQRRNLSATINHPNPSANYGAPPPGNHASSIRGNLPSMQKDSNSSTESGEQYGMGYVPRQGHERLPPPPVTVQPQQQRRLPPKWVPDSGRGRSTY
ncbi:hypothetical protein B9479_000340 [Cryptococcus floricola]|uniref:Cytochrome b561 domain-containing protein n=1 Tax=Cryptococcus floricola TaxID=2591691 RepID=A0A5D3B5K0_9TREE|nr:hypothetical protein B9479_000340 [Cryptococcus floricola]